MIRNSSNVTQYPLEIIVNIFPPEYFIEFDYPCLSCLFTRCPLQVTQPE